jgi:hypothetical protein
LTEFPAPDGDAIGFIGLGTMGMPMASRLVKAGFSVYGADLSSAARSAFARNAGTAFPMPREAAEGVSILITMLPDGATVRKALLGPDGACDALASAALVIDMSSSEPMGTRQLAQELSARGVFLIDAPVSGGVRRATDGTLAIMAGGDAAQIERARPILRAMGSNIIATGPVGSGHAVKARWDRSPAKIGNGSHSPDGANASPAHRHAARGARAGRELVVFTELALTTFFPRWLIDDEAELDSYYETRDARPGDAPLFEEAARLGVGFYLGYAELVTEGRAQAPLQHLDPRRRHRRDRRQVPQGAPARHTPSRSRPRVHQHLEKRYFEPGDLGFGCWRAFGGSWACASATTAAGPRPTASWACRASRWSCWATTPLRPYRPSSRSTA